jgi:hypothetical protein
MLNIRNLDDVVAEKGANQEMFCIDLHSIAQVMNDLAWLSFSPMMTIQFTQYEVCSNAF